ncbi:hypothetical protein N9546_01935 [Flavobacteriaceae bacterium]|nr:hypothetical protein [Flavobacteriaceae bacterium]
MKYFFLLLPIFITAQFTNVKGFVKSDYGNLGYASVSLLKSEKGVITNDNGSSYAYAPNHGAEFFIGYRFIFGN